MRFDPSIVTVKQWSIVSQIVSSPVVLSLSLSVETSVTVNNSPIQDYVQPEDQTQPTLLFLSSRFFLHFWCVGSLDINNGRFHTTDG